MGGGVIDPAGYLRDDRRRRGRDDDDDDDDGGDALTVDDAKIPRHRATLMRAGPPLRRRRRAPRLPTGPACEDEEARGGGLCGRQRRE
jgi:hypothetical protein|tara:strand:+ start:381 stop:644 length:264 start_codon:yes stop_codon:yes gene_type:complete